MGNEPKLLTDSIYLKLKNIFMSADSVVLVGHIGKQYEKLEDVNNTSVPPVLINGRPNYSVVKKRAVVIGAQLDSLLKLLLKNTSDSISNTTKCEFDPHHTIFIIKNGVSSYIDLCFLCHQFEASDDLKLLIFLDNTQWDDLEKFFVKLNVRYHQYPNLN